MDPSIIIALITLVLAIIGTIAIWGDARRQLSSWATRARRSASSILDAAAVGRQEATATTPGFPDLASVRARAFLKLNPSLQRRPAVDDCIVLVHSPSYRGWDPDQIHLKFSDQVIKHVRGAHDEHVQKGKNAFSGDNRTKYCLLSYTQPLLDASGNTLTLELGYTDFRTSSSVYELLDHQLPVLDGSTVFDRFASNLITHSGGARFAVASEVIPVIPCVDLTVIGSDDKIVLLRRSEAVHFFPGTWTATIEEQMKAPWEGQKGDKSILEAAMRSLEEELCTDPRKLDRYDSSHRICPKGETQWENDGSSHPSSKPRWC